VVIAARFDDLRAGIALGFAGWSEALGERTHRLRGRVEPSA